MSPARPSRGRARRPRKRRAGGGSRAAAWLLVLVVAAAGVGAYRYRPQLEQAWARWRGTPAARTAGAPAPVGRRGAAGTATATVGCWSPEGRLRGRGLALSQQAKFETIEQFTARGAKLNAPAYRVPARLLGYEIAPDQALVLHLDSLVHPKLTLDARLPAGRCVANADDAALFDQLREDLTLRFGPAGRQPVTLAQPAEVVVTGVAQGAGATLQLAPVLDFQVQ